MANRVHTGFKDRLLQNDGTVRNLTEVLHHVGGVRDTVSQSTINTAVRLGLWGSGNIVQWVNVGFATVTSPAVFDLEDNVGTATPADNAGPISTLVVASNWDLNNPTAPSAVVVYDTLAGLPFTPAGEGISIVFSNSANRVFRL